MSMPICPCNYVNQTAGLCGMVCHVERPWQTACGPATMVAQLLPFACCRYAAGALERVLELNRVVWQDEGLGERAAKLLRDIESGMSWADG